MPSRTAMPGRLGVRDGQLERDRRLPGDNTSFNPQAPGAPRRRSSDTRRSTPAAATASAWSRTTPRLLPRSPPSPRTGPITGNHGTGRHVQRRLRHELQQDAGRADAADRGRAGGLAQPHSKPAPRRRGYAAQRPDRGCVVAGLLGVQETPLGNWNRIAFERVTPTTSVTGLDMAPFIKRAESSGAISRTGMSRTWKPDSRSGQAETAWRHLRSRRLHRRSAAPHPPSGHKDHTKPSVVLSLPVCSITYSADKCAALRRTAGAGRPSPASLLTTSGSNSVTVTAVRARTRRAPSATITTTAKLLKGTAFDAKLTGLTTGSWTFTATAVDSSGNERTTKPIHVNINFGPGPVGAPPSTGVSVARDACTDIQDLSWR